MSGRTHQAAALSAVRAPLPTLKMTNPVECDACCVYVGCVAGKACQKANWRDHKPHCKPQELREKEAAERAAERAAQRAAHKSGSGGAVSEAAVSSDKQD